MIVAAVVVVVDEVAIVVAVVANMIEALVVDVVVFVVVEGTTEREREMTNLGDATARASAADEGLYSCELGSGVVSL